MCSKSGNGLKRIGIGLLFLVLVVGQLAAAWPWAWKKEVAPQSPPLVQVLQADSQEATLFTAKSVQDLQKQLESLQPVLAGYVQLEQDWKTQLEENGLWLGDLETSIESLIVSSTKVETLVPIEIASSTDLQEDYDKLIVIDQDLAERVKPMWGGMVGAGASYDPVSGDLGVTLDLGIRYDTWMLTVGAKAMPDWDDIKNFSRYIPVEYRLGIVKSF